MALHYILAVVLIIAASYQFYQVLQWSIERDYKKWMLNDQGIETITEHDRGWWDRIKRGWYLPFIMIAAQIAWAGSATWWTLVACFSAFGLLMTLFWLLFDGGYNMRRRAYAKRKWYPADAYRKFTYWFQGSDDPRHPNAKADGIPHAKFFKLSGIVFSLAGYITSLLM